MGAGQKKQPMATQASKSNRVCELCATPCMPHYKKICPKISVLCHTSNLPNMTIIAEATKFVTLLMGHLCQRPSLGQIHKSLRWKKSQRVVLTSGFQSVCSAGPQDFSGPLVAPVSLASTSAASTWLYILNYLVSLHLKGFYWLKQLAQNSCPRPTPSSFT